MIILTLALAGAEAVTQLDVRPPGDDMLQTSLETAIKFDRNVDGFYDGSEVKVLEGSAATAELIKGEHFHRPHFVLEYHPQCPHCKTMVGDFKHLAHRVHQQKLDVDIVAVNMSKSDQEALHPDGYPTIRFYTKPNEFKEFDDHRSYAAFKEFLEGEGIKFKK